MEMAKRILVGLKTRDHAEELVDMACRMGAPNAFLHLVHVIELPDPTPLTADVPDLEAEAREILAKGEAAGRRASMTVHSMILRAHNAASALLDEMEQKQIELAVLGYHHRRTLGEMILGTTAQHLARHAPCRLLLSIPRRS